MSEANTSTPAASIRGLARRLPYAALGTRMRGGDGEPYVSLVLVAVAHDSAPILLLSRLADHTKNVIEDARVSLLFDGTVGWQERLAGERATLQGTIWRTEDRSLRERFLRRHPEARLYADFRDFAFYTVTITRAHLVAGFGRIHWVEGSDVLLDAAPFASLADREADIVAHMNADHADAVRLYANVLLGRTGGNWILTGVDPEGCDLRAGGDVARLPFAKPVRDAESARVELVRLVKQARQLVQ